MNDTKATGDSVPTKDRRGKPPVKHMVDGREMTVKEIAGMLGVTPRTITIKRSTLGGVSYQMIVDMYRSNQMLGTHDKYPRHMVEGEWLTIKEAALRAGVSVHTIRHWRDAHRDALGNRPTMAEALEHYRRYQTGEDVRPRGRTPKRYRVGRKMLSVPEAAAEYGTTVNSLYKYMRRNGVSLQVALNRLETRRKRKAERDIMRILGF